ncbi:NAD kinase [Periweissella ghanensis]|uniref:NAD kinase n=1 Tax=Periweissella ghanensis TaxID=467997 RepID=A0ABM8ZB40_9LACO|nr:NAD kinase [Periweissella ghanensis]MCM0600650.1 NAD kinase [Periweissella ghanensis]CAH0418460.1 NAD kinase [Periweissella ghanensis]
MRVGLYANNSARSQRVAKNLTNALIAKNIPIDNDHPEVLISIGGDGTLLGAFQKYQTQLSTLRFVGLHTGHLGFYTDWREYEIDDLIASLINDKQERVEYPILETTVTYVDGSTEVKLALNESMVKRVSGTVVADVYLGDQWFERFRGDGMAISTPTGSTAYNKAIGGAVLHPSLAALQLAELASINNQVYRTLGSPLVTAPDEIIKIVPQDADGLILTYDQGLINSHAVKEISYRIAPHRIAFAEYRHMQFWRRVNESFIGHLKE